MFAHQYIWFHSILHRLPSRTALAKAQTVVILNSDKCKITDHALHYTSVTVVFIYSAILIKCLSLRCEIFWQNVQIGFVISNWYTPKVNEWTYGTVFHMHSFLHLVFHKDFSKNHYLLLSTKLNAAHWLQTWITTFIYRKDVCMFLPYIIVVPEISSWLSSWYYPFDGIEHSKVECSLTYFLIIAVEM